MQAMSQTSLLPNEKPLTENKKDSLTESTRGEGKVLKYCSRATPCLWSCASLYQIWTYTYGIISPTWLCEDPSQQQRCADTFTKISHCLFFFKRRRWGQEGPICNSSNAEQDLQGRLQSKLACPAAIKREKFHRNFTLQAHHLTCQVIQKASHVLTKSSMKATTTSCSIWLCCVTTSSDCILFPTKGARNCSQLRYKPVLVRFLFCYQNFYPRILGVVAWWGCWEFQLRDPKLPPQNYNLQGSLRKRNRY